MKNIFRNCIIIIFLFIFYVNLNFLTLPKSFATEFGRPSTYSTEKIVNAGLSYGSYDKQLKKAGNIYNSIYTQYSLKTKFGRLDFELSLIDEIFKSITKLYPNDININLLNDCYNEYLKLPLKNNIVACCQFCDKLRKNHIQAFLIGVKVSNVLEEKTNQEFVIYILEKDNSEKEYWIANFDNPFKMPIKDFVKVDYEITYYFEPADGLDFSFCK